MTYTIGCVKHFSRDYRETIGKCMVEHATAAYMMICEANPRDSAGKVECLEKAEYAVRMLDCYFHAAFDIRALEGMKKRSDAAFLCADALSDIVRWKRYNAKQLQDGRQQDRLVTAVGS